MVLDWIFGPLACLSLALLLWQWLVARRFPLHRRASDQSFAPAVTLLKPLKGGDASTGDCLRSWFTQDYAGKIQVLLGVAAADDPACGIVQKLIQDFPELDARLVVCSPLLGANAKVSQLAELEKLARHDVFVVSDADVRVPPDFLANAVAPLAPMNKENPVGRDALPRVQAERPVLRSSTAKGGQVGPAPRTNEVGLVSCLYGLANPSTLAMQWEAIAINADFWSQVLQSRSLRPLDFALGAVMVARREQLAEIGGFKALADCLADDYQLGNRIARQGYLIALCPVVAECWDPPMTWRDVWKHQLRWARTIRVCRALPYFFSILANVTFWALVWFIVQCLTTSGGPLSLGTGGCGGWRITAHFGAALALIFGLVRIVVGYDLQRRLTRSSSHAKYFWLVPLKDLLQVLVWLCAFAGNRIEWRGRKFVLRRDGTLLET